MDKQIKSKERVKKYGEVFTPESVVNKMLQSVENELYRIDSRFLEPACGTGNFLVPVLNTKLDEVRKKYKKSKYEYEQQSLLALGSIYGIEVLHDNVIECRNRLFDIWEAKYKSCFREVDEEIIKSAAYILEKNIVHGDALSMTDSKGNPLILSEWSIVSSGLFQRRDYLYKDLRETANPLNYEETSLVDQRIVGYRRLWNDGN